MKTIVAAAIIGALGGLLGALLGKLFSKNTRSSRGNLGAIVGIVVAITLSNGTGLKEKLADLIFPPSPLEKFGKQVLEIPGVKEKVKNKSPEEIRGVTQQLSAAGMLKVDSSMLVTRVKLLCDMLKNTDESKCGRFAKGQLQGDDILSMMESITQERQSEWLTLIHAAVEAEVGGKAAPQLPNPTEVMDALAQVTSQVTESERQRFTTNLGTMEKLNDQEACWTAKTLYEAVAKTPGQAQLVAARALVMP